MKHENIVESKTCTKCDEVKLFIDYGYSKKGRFNLLSWCRKCENERQQVWKITNKAKLNARAREYYRKNANEDPAAFYRNKRSKTIKLTYGITIDEYEEKLRQQNYICAVCRDAFDLSRGRYAFSLDHDHVTGKVRDFLCNPCNMALGAFKDDAGVLSAAIKYIERHKNEA